MSYSEYCEFDCLLLKLPCPMLNLNVHGKFSSCRLLGHFWPMLLFVSSLLKVTVVVIRTDQKLIKTMLTLIKAMEL